MKAEKCELLVPPSPGDGRLDYAKALSPIPVLDGAFASIRIVGAHVGADASSFEFLKSKWLPTKILIDTIASDIAPSAPRAGIALLKYCCQPKLLYRFQTHRPEICRPLAIEYDARIVAALRSFIGDVDRDLIISSYGLRFLDYPACLHLLFKRFMTDEPADHHKRSKELGDSDAMTELRTAHDLTVLKRFPHLKARLLSQAAAGFGSTSWSSSFAPKGFCAHLADVMLLLRMQLLVEPPSPAPCWCGHADTGNGTFPEHVLCCSRLQGATRVYRHNVILGVLTNAIARFGILAVAEPRFYQYEDGSKKRPDLTCFVGDQFVVTDLVVSHDPEEALKEKQDKHDAAAAALGHKFVPIAISIFGQLHPSVDEFLRRVFADLPYKTRWLAILQTKRLMSEAWLCGTAAMLRGVHHHADNFPVMEMCRTGSLGS